MKSESRQGKCGPVLPLKLTVQDGESWRGLEGKEICHREVKKLCSDVGLSRGAL